MYNLMSAWRPVQKIWSFKGLIWLLKTRTSGPTSIWPQRVSVLTQLGGCCQSIKRSSSTRWKPLTSSSLVAAKIGRHFMSPATQVLSKLLKSWLKESQSTSFHDLWTISFPDKSQEIPLSPKYSASMSVKWLSSSLALTKQTLSPECHRGVLDPQLDSRVTPWSSNWWLLDREIGVDITIVSARICSSTSSWWTRSPYSML